MEAWEEEIIDKHLVKLLHQTICTTVFKASLKSKGLITDEEEQLLSKAGEIYGRQKEAKDVYSILKTRQNGFVGLIEGLHETNQTGAWTILNNARSDNLATQLQNLQIYINGDSKQLTALISLPLDEAKRILENKQLNEEFTRISSSSARPLQLHSITPEFRELYVERSLSNRLLVEPELFKADCRDIFVFKDIFRYDLDGLVEPHVTRVSSNQRKSITCRHIYLEKEEDWDDLLLLCKDPMHLIQKVGTEYVLQRTTEVTPNILQHSINNRTKEAYMSEGKFVETMSSPGNTDGALVCDVPGMGKTWLMESIAQKLGTRCTKTLVYYVQLSTFSRKWCNDLEAQQTTAPLEFLLQCIYDSKLASSILSILVNRNIINVTFVLDGFDEIRDVHVDETTKCLQQINSAMNVKLIISSRPHMRARLEDSFKLISFDILPFQMEEQVNTIVGKWKQSISNCDANLMEYAKQTVVTIKNINQQEGAEEVLGLPLRCYLLSVVNEKHAKLYAEDSRKTSLEIDAKQAINSIYGLYEEFVDTSMQNMANKLSFELTESFRENIVTFHTYLALQLLYPSIAIQYMSEKNLSIVTAGDCEYIMAGILSCNHQFDYEFTHRTFAEYFVGKFFAVFWTNINLFQPSFVASVGKNFLTTIISVSVDDIQWIFKEITFEESSHIYKRITRFNSGTIPWFMDRTFANMTTFKCSEACARHFQEVLYSEVVPFDSSMRVRSTDEKDKCLQDCKTAISNGIYFTLIACVENQLINLLGLLKNILFRMFTKTELSTYLVIPNLMQSSKRFQNIKYEDAVRVSIPLLLYVAAANGSPEVAKGLHSIFDDGNDHILLNFCQQFPLEYVSPLEIAVLRHDVDTAMHYLKKVNIPWERLLIAFLVGTEMTEWEKKARLTMFENFQKHSKWSEISQYINKDTLRNYLTDLTMNEVYNLVLLRSFAADHNLRLNHLPGRQKRLLLRQAMYLDTQAFNSQCERILAIHCHKKTRKYFFRSQDGQLFVELLQLLFGKIASTYADKPPIESFIDITDARVNFCKLKLPTYQVPFENIRNFKVLEVIIGQSFKMCNVGGWNYLHYAVLLQRLDWIKELIKLKYDVNDRSSDGKTPLMCLTSVPHPNLMSEITRLLVENGADVYAVDNKKQNFAHLSIETGHVMENWIKYTVDEGFLKLWGMEDINGKTPLETLVTRTGLKHSAARVFLRDVVRNKMTESNKAVILSSALPKFDDAETLNLLLFLFPRLSSESHSRLGTEYRNRNPVRINSDACELGSVLQSLDLINAHRAFLQIRFMQGMPFENTEKIETLEIVLAMCPDFTLCRFNEKKRNYLHYAANQGKVDWLIRLIQMGFDVNQTDLNGNTPLLCLSDKNPLEIVTVLHLQILNIYAVNKDGKNLARMFLEANKQQEVKKIVDFVAFTLNNGYDKLWNMEYGNSGGTPFLVLLKVLGIQHPLVNAVMELRNATGLIRVADKRAILEATIDAKTDQDLFKMIWFLFKRSKFMVLNQFHRNLSGNDMVDFPVQDSIAQDILLSSIDIDAAKETFNLLNFKGLFKKPHDIVSLRVLSAISNDVSHGATNPKRRNFLHHAVKYGKVSWLKELITSGLNINQRDINGNTPLLRLSLKTPYLDVFRELLENGADVFAENNKMKNVADRLITKCDQNDLDGLLQWFRYTLDNGFHRLWTKQHKNTQTSMIRLMNIQGAAIKALESADNIIVQQDRVRRNALSLAIRNYADDEFIKVLILLFSKMDSKIVLSQIHNDVGKSKSENVLDALDITVANGTFLSQKYFTDTDLLDIRHVETLKVIVGICPNFTSCNSYRRNYLHYAVDQEKIDWLEFLIQANFDVNQVDMNHSTPLHLIPSVECARDITEILQKAGADIYALDCMDRNVAHTLLYRSYNCKLIVGTNALLNWFTYTHEHGYSSLWNMTDSSRRTPLQLLGFKCFESAIPELLIELRRNAMVGIVTMYEFPEANKCFVLQQALSAARDIVFTDLIMLLFRKTNNPSMYDSVQEILASIDVVEASNVFSRIEMVPGSAFTNLYTLNTLRLCLELCPDATHCNQDGMNYLHFAVKHGKLSWVEFLVNNGCDVNQRDVHGNTPLLKITSANPLQVTRLLLENGGKLAVVNNMNENVACVLLRETNSESEADVKNWVEYIMQNHYDKFSDLTEQLRCTSHYTKFLGLAESSFPNTTGKYSDQGGYQHRRLKQQALLGYVLANYGDSHLLQTMYVFCGYHDVKTRRQKELTEYKTAESVLENIDVNVAKELFGLLKVDSDFDFFNRLKSIETLKLLLELWPEYRESSSKKRSFLHIATSYGRVDWVKCLIKAGYNLNEKDSYFLAPIDYIETNAVEITKALMEAGVNIGAVVDGFTIVHSYFSSFMLRYVHMTRHWVSFMLRNGFRHLWSVKWKSRTLGFFPKDPFQILSSVALRELNAGGICTDPFNLLFLFNEDFHFYTNEMHYVFPSADASLKHLVFVRGLDLRHLPVHVKRCILQEAVFAGNDDEFINIALLLFPNTAIEQSVSNIVIFEQPNCRCDILDLLRLLDLESARKTFKEIYMRSRIPFKNMVRLETLKVLVALNEDFTKCHANLWNYLHIAVKLNKLNWVEHLVQSGYDVNQRDASGSTPLLLISSIEEAAEMTQVLVAGGADIYASDQTGRNSARTIMDLLVHADQTWYFLMWFKYTLQHEYINLWNMTDKKGNSFLEPLGLQALFPTVLKELRFFALSRNATLHSWTESNKCCLLEAAIRVGTDHEFIETLLLLFGNISHNEERRPVTYFNAENIYKYINLPDAKAAFSNLKTARMASFENMCTVETIKICVELCRDFTSCNPDGMNYLHFAVKLGHVCWVKFLISEGQDVNQMDIHGNTPLLLISPKQSLEMTQLLLAKNAKFDVFNHSNDNVARVLLRNANSECLKYVINWVEYIMEKGYHKVLRCKYEGQSKSPFCTLLKMAGSVPDSSNPMVSQHTKAMKQNPNSKQAIFNEVVCNYGDKQVIEALLLFCGKGCLENDEQETTELGNAELVVERLDLANAKATFSQLRLKKGLTCFSNMKQIETLKLFTMLLPDFSICNIPKYNYLHFAVYEGRIDWVNYLVKTGYNMNDKAHGNNFTPLHCVNKNLCETTTAVIDLGAFVEAETSYGENFLAVTFASFTYREIDSIRPWATELLRKGYRKLWRSKSFDDAFQILGRRAIENLKSFPFVNPFELLFMFNEEFHYETSDLANESNQTLSSLLTVVMKRQLTLNHLSLDTKCSILQGAIRFAHDFQMIGILLILFPTERSQVSELNINVLVERLTGYQTDEILKWLDVKVAFQAFLKLDMVQLDFFSNIERWETIKILTRICKDFAECNGQRWNYLHIAVKNNKILWVDYLIQTGYDVNQPDINGNTPLHLVSTQKLDRLGQLLVVNKANVNALNHERQSIAQLLLAKCDQNNVSEVIMFLEYMSLKTCSNNLNFDITDKMVGKTTIMQLLETVYLYPTSKKTLNLILGLIKRLELRQGISVKHLSGERKVELLKQALCWSNDEQFIHVLLLLYGEGNLYEEERLETCGTSGFDFTSEFYHKLHWIMKSLYISDVSADFRLTSLQEQIVLKNMNNIETLKFLMRIFPKIKDVNYYQYNYLHLAVHHGNLDWVNHLIGTGQDVNEPDMNGNTPLLWVTSKHPLDMIRILIMNNANPTVINLENQNIIHRLMYNFSMRRTDTLYDVVIYMLENFPHNLWSMLDANGNTPYELLRSRALADIKEGASHDPSILMLFFNSSVHTRAHIMLPIRFNMKSLVTVVFKYRMNLQRLEESTKITLLNNALVAANDECIIYLLVLLFPNSTAEIELSRYLNQSISEGSIWKNISADELLELLDENSAKEIFTKLNVNVHKVFRNIKQLRTLKVLLAVCPDFTLCNKDKANYLSYAVSLGRTEWIKYLISARHDVNHADIDKDTPLHAITPINALSISRILFENGAIGQSVNALNMTFARKFFERCSKPGKLDSVVELAAYIIENFSEDIWTVSDYAYNLSSLQYLKSLLGLRHILVETVVSIIVVHQPKHALWEVRDLQDVIQNGDDNNLIKKLLQLFRKMEENTELKCKKEEDKLYLNNSNDIHEMEAEDILNHLDVVTARETFLRLYLGYFNLHGFNDLRSLKVLIGICPQFLVANVFERNYLHYAVEKGNVEWVRHLVQLGHNVNQRDKYGYTPLHCLGVINLLTITQLLIENGADGFVLSPHGENLVQFLQDSYVDFQSGLPEDWVAYMTQNGYDELFEVRPGGK